MKLQKETEGGQVAEKQAHGKWYDDACGAAFAMELIGERWSILIVREMMLGGRRFSDIRASLPGLSAKTLTERLQTLESVGLVRRTTSGPPASVQIYDLTDWGRSIEPVLQELGRWAVRSPLHDPRLPLTPVAFMLSLRTMFEPAAAEGMAMTILFEVGDVRFIGQLAHSSLAITRIGRETIATDVTFSAATATDYLPIFYGKQPLDAPGMKLEVAGDRAAAEAFIALFGLPAKHADGALSL